VHFVLAAIDHRKSWTARWTLCVELLTSLSPAMILFQQQTGPDDSMRAGRCSRASIDNMDELRF
jgi:hypothetical protein